MYSTEGLTIGERIRRREHRLGKREVVRRLTACFLEVKARELQALGQESFTIGDLIGEWPEEFLPFRTIYPDKKIAGAEAGKLLKRVAKKCGWQMVFDGWKHRYSFKEAVVKH